MKRIYMVEDNPDNADLVLDLLEDSYEIVHFLDANAALDRLKSIQPEELPHLFLLDISLPGMDGITLLRTLRQHPTWKTIPAIALTAHAMKSEKEGLMSVGFDGYVSKPIVDESALTTSIEKLT